MWLLVKCFSSSALHFSKPVTLIVGTQAFDKLSAIVTNKRLLDDIRQMSPRFQTFSVESFHSIINRFAPKAYAFSFHGMFARQVCCKNAWENV